MEPHVKNYFKAFGYDQSSFIPCEHCGAKSVDLHHVEPRSKFGKKRKAEQDDPSNIIALCRSCHDAAHGPLCRWYKEVFKGIIKKRRSLLQTEWGC